MFARVRLLQLILALAMPLALAPAAVAQIRSEANVYAVRLAWAPDLERAPVLLRQPVTVRMKRVTVGKALAEIVQRAGISLAYSPAIVPVERVVSLDLENSSVLEALHALLGETDIELWVTADGRMALVPGAPTVAGEGAAERAATVAGRVTVAGSGEPLSNATVTVRGTTLRGISDGDGRYSIAGVPAGPRTLDVQRLGFRRDSAMTTISEDASMVTVDFSLTRQALTLESIVTIGYGTQQAQRVTGAVATVNSEQFNTGRVVSAEELIQGKVAGLQVANTGEPGGGVSIRIRGGTSVNASNEPLFVVDGIPLPVGGGLSSGRNPLNFLNPEDVENVTVLKDASATAIFGSRGANGVVIIETKSGTTRGPQFTYSTSVSTSQTIAEPDMLSTAEFRAAVAANAASRVALLGTANTNWRDAVLRNAGGQEHNLSVIGAGDAMSYRLSVGYLEQAGVVRGSETERLSAALNYDHRLFRDRLNLQGTLRGARTADQFTPGGGLGAATVFDPTQPTKTSSGAWFEHTTFPLSVTNPLAELALGVDEGTTFRGIGSLEARYAMPFMDALSATTRLGFDVASSERRTFYSSSLFGQSRTAMPGYMNRSNPRETTSLIDAFLTYSSSKTPLRGDIDATVGYSYEGSRGDYPYFEARGLSTDLLGPSGVPSATETTPRLSVREGRLASFFGRVNYTFGDKYTAMVSVRRDGTSKFAPGNQWGTFPAAALAWRLSEENFLRGSSTFSDLKLRVSWGVNGNQSVGDYLWVPSYLFGDAQSQVQFGNSYVTTIRPSAVDEAIKWEETTSYNIGADFGLFDNRLIGSLEYYVKDTDDLLFSVPVAAGTFVSNFVTTNVGDMRNKGIELSLTTELLQPASPRGLRWTASLNAARNSNELLTVNPFGNGGEQILVGGIAGGVGSNIQVLQPGFPVNSFFVYQHKRDGNGKPVVGPNDLARYEDLNGDGVINQSDRRAYKSPAPDWILGHTSSLGLGNFDATLTLRAQLGNHVYNNLASSQGYYGRLNEAAGPVNLHASVLEYGFTTPQYFSDVYVEDASFLRLDNLTIAYSLPRFRGTQQLRVFGGVQNAFTLTGYSGPDPMAGLNGIDNNIYPRSRTFSAGVSVGF